MHRSTLVFRARAQARARARKVDGKEIDLNYFQIGTILLMYKGRFMFPSLFIKGWVIGFSIAMPVGPIGILCIQHSLIRGMLYGLIAGLGAALADTVYGAIAGLGISAISSLLVQNQFWIQLLGALFLWYLGFSIYRSKPPVNAKEAEKLGLWRVFLTTFALTLTNPMTMVCFAGIYAGFGICLPEEGLLSIALLAGGVLIGSAAWWLLLSCGVALIREKVSLQTPWLNKISGGVILFFAAVASVTALQQLLSL